MNFFGKVVREIGVEELQSSLVGLQVVELCCSTSLFCISLTADGPQRARLPIPPILQRRHPACGYEGSSHLLRGTETKQRPIFICLFFTVFFSLETKT